MSQIVDEVLAANKKYASSFGAKKDLALPPARDLRYSLAWMRGSIRRNMPAYPKVTPTSFAMRVGVPVTMPSDRSSSPTSYWERVSGS